MPYSLLTIFRSKSTSVSSSGVVAGTTPHTTHPLDATRRLAPRAGSSANIAHPRKMAEVKEGVINESAANETGVGHGNDDKDTQKQIVDGKQEQVNKHCSKVNLGGENCKGNPAYAVLTGKWKGIDDESNPKGEEILVNIPITRLPIVLGRRWESTAKNPHHVALPRDEKLLSRLHACIFFRDAKGGRLGCYQIISGGESGSTRVSDNIMYTPLGSDEGEGESFDPDSIYRLPGMKQTDPLPSNGFFAIECLGRHTIKVGKQRVTKGKQAMLQDGSAIQIASYCFYFLLPKNAPPISQTFKYPVKKPLIQKETKAKTKNCEVTKSDESKGPPAKKIKRTEESYTAKLENISTKELISQFTIAIESEQWTKDDQQVSATLGMRIVRDAAKDAKIQKIAREQHGVTQRDIIDWYNAHPLFSDFERLMLSKIEYKSYQSSITKAIQRARYTRNESNPGKSRSTRWDLPSDIPMVPFTPSSARSHVKSPRKLSEGAYKTQTSMISGKADDLQKTPLIIEAKENSNKVIENKECSGANSPTSETEDVPLSELEKTLSPPKQP